MTDQEMRIAIAKSCGWTYVYSEQYAITERETKISGIPPGSNVRYPIPDYLNDLNDSASMEKTIHNDIGLRNEYARLLREDNPQTDWFLLRSAARQRAIAFAKVKGIYRET